jgi:uncharacterized protein YndB with AHSA1/START domain
MTVEEKAIRKEMPIPAGLEQVWCAWSTLDGVQSFFAPQAKVELAIGGAYEMYFDLAAPPGSRGGEGCRILSYLPPRMLSFSWNAPPRYPTVREVPTWVVVEVEEQGATACQVRLTHLGWRVGGEWDEVYDYFVRAWDLVLMRLAYRFSTGPVDWEDPPR